MVHWPLGDEPQVWVGFFKNKWYQTNLIHDIKILFEAGSISRRVSSSVVSDSAVPWTVAWASLVAQRLKHLPPMRETWVRSLGREDPLEKEWQPTAVFLPGSYVHGILQARILEWTAIPFSRGYSWPRLARQGVRWASQVALVVENLRETGSISGSRRFPGGENDNLLQYPSLENPTDRGAWRATVHRVAKSQAWLKRLSMHAWEGKEAIENKPSNICSSTKITGWVVEKDNFLYHVQCGTFISMIIKDIKWEQQYHFKGNWTCGNRYSKLTWKSFGVFLRVVSFYLVSTLDVVVFPQVARW